MVRVKDERTFCTMAQIGIGQLKFPKYSLPSDAVASVWPSRLALLAFHYELELMAELEGLEHDPAALIARYETVRGAASRQKYLHQGVPVDDASEPQHRTQHASQHQTPAAASVAGAVPPSHSSPASTSSPRPTIIDPATLTFNVHTTNPPGVAGAVDRGGASVNARSVTVAEKNGAVSGEGGSATQGGASLPPPACYVYSVDGHSMPNFSALWIATKIEVMVTVAYEELKEWTEAIARRRTLLAQPCLSGRRGGWWDKLALHLERHVLQPAAAVDACKTGIADPFVRSSPPGRIAAVRGCCLDLTLYLLDALHNWT
jgi:hypothetical protein